MEQSEKVHAIAPQRLKRWRLILGKESENTLGNMSKDEISLSREQTLMDQALAALYDNTEGADTLLGAGYGASNPNVSKWLGDIRTLFDKEIVTVIQNDAIERKGLKQLLFEPEMLEKVEPNIGLASTLLTLKNQIPKRSKESVRAFIQKIVEEINRSMEHDLRRAVTAALNKRQHSSLPSASAIDYKCTIERNLKNYNKTLKTIVPDRVFFYDRASKMNKWNVILDIDQSGSMSESVIYSSVMSCILASMNSVKTHIVAFDTEVVDLTEKSDDPVDLLYGFNLGGGTDINKSVAYCEQFIETPKKTLLFLITDLCEGGNSAALIRRLGEIKQAGVTVICLLAIADKGTPYYDKDMTNRVAKLGIPCFACTPEKLPQLFEAALKGHELSQFSKK
ncbi:MAG: VWA domain-containing protein [Lachnospiraceae bacterium]|nr:VWA domain-containing protein [Lachnospiraceae bacterium]